MADTRIGRRLKVLTGYSAHARFLAETDDGIVGEIPREVHTPYAFSSTHQVIRWNGVPVIVAETGQRRYEVFEVTGQIDPAQD